MNKVPGEDVGVSVVTGAIMVLAVFFIIFSLFLAFWLPRQGYDREREQMEEVRESFFKLKSAVETLELLGSRSVDVKMSSDRGTIFPLPSSAGSLLVEPALRVQTKWTQVSWRGGATGVPPQVGRWGDVYDNYCLGENVDVEADLTLWSNGGYRPSGYLESSVYDAGDIVNWGIISWSASTPYLLVGENRVVQAEPSTLVDGSSRVGVIVGGSLLNTQSKDGTYEVIAENSVLATFTLVNSPSSTPAGNWTNPTNAYTSNDIYATTSTDGATQQYGRYGFNLPANATITDVEVGFELRVGLLAQVAITCSWDNGNTWASERTFLRSLLDPEMLTYENFASATTWTPSKLSDENFRTRIRVSWTWDGVYLDWMPVMVTYSVPVYRLRWEHRITSVPDNYESYRLRIYGYADADEQVKVLVWKASASQWVVMGNLSTTPGWLIYDIPDNINNYLVDGNLSVLYLTERDDNTQTKIYIDYCVLEAAMPRRTYVRVYTRTGSDDNPYAEGGQDNENWSDWQLCSAGDDIPSPSNRYIQYRVELETEDATIAPALHTISIGYWKFAGFGVVQFDKRNSFYRSQTWVYEGGAVILVQDNVDVMISPPPMVTAVDAGGGNIKVEVHVVRITGVKSSVSGMGLSTLLVSLRNSAYMERPVSGPNRKHVVIAVDSTYKNAWVGYLRYLKKLLDEKGYNAVLDESALTLTIFGKGAPGVNDIYYYEKFTEVEVAVG